MRGVAPGAKLERLIKTLMADTITDLRFFVKAVEYAYDVGLARLNSRFPAVVFGRLLRQGCDAPGLMTQYKERNDELSRQTLSGGCAPAASPGNLKGPTRSNQQEYAKSCER